MNKNLELILKAMRRNRRDLLIGLGAGAAALIAEKLIADQTVKQEQQKKEEETRDTAIKDFRVAADNYQEAVSNGTLDLGDILRLIKCTDQLHVYVSSQDKPYDPSMVRLGTLLDVVYTETEKMIEEKSKAGKKKKKPDVSTDETAIRCLREYLTIQKFLLENQAE